MATFGQMKQWVSKRLLDANGTAVSSDDVGELINQSIDYWKKRRFWFNEETTTDTLLQGDPAIPLPSDFLMPSINDSFILEYSGIRYPLRKISEVMYNAFYLSNGVGQPWYFSRQAQTEYQVYPIPDRDYTIRIFYLKEYEALSNDSDENDWTGEAQDLIKYTAASYGMNDFRQDFTAADRFMAQAMREYNNLLVQTRKDNATGSATIYSMLNSY